MGLGPSGRLLMEIPVAMTMRDTCIHKRFGDIATFSRGLTFAKGDVAVNSSKRVLRSNNIDLQSHSLNFDDIACLKEEFIIPDEKKLHKGDIFICMSNGSTQHLGKVAYVEEDMDYAFGGFMGAIHPNENMAFPKYAYYACISSEYQHFLASIFNGVNINNLKWSDLANLEIPIPPLDKQERIVAELDLLTGIIDKQKSQLKELDNLAQSIFYDMFGDPVENEKGWETKMLKDTVHEMFLGPFGSSLKTDCYVSKDEAFCMVYEQKHAIRKTMNVETHYIDKSKYDSLRRFEVHSGDFIMSCRGTIGEVFRLPLDAPVGIIHPSLMKIRIKEDVYNPTFFLWFLSKLIKNENTNGNCVQMAITAKELGQRKPVVPPLTLQQSFAQKIQSIESQKAAINRSIAETQKLFDYTMDKYFG